MNCSGRGDLVDGVCVCYDGWASTGDMRSQIGLDCDVTTVYVRLGFALGMLIIGIAFLQSGLTVWSAYQNNGGLKALQHRNNIVQICICANAVVFGILALLKLIDPARFVIGIDPFTSFMYTFGIQIFFVWVTIFSHIYIYVSMKQERFKGNMQIHSMLRGVKWVLVFNACSMMIVQTLPVVASFVRIYDYQTAVRIIKSFWIAQGILVLLLMIFFPLSVAKLMHDMQKLVDRNAADSVEAVERALRGLRRGIRQVIIRCLINSSIVLAMGLSDFGYWSPYLIATQSFILPVLMLNAGKLIAANSKRNTSSSERFSKKKSSKTIKVGQLDKGGSMVVTPGDRGTSSLVTSKDSKD